MSSTTETRTVVEQIVDNADERELWITGRLFEHAPYFHPGKGGDTRLAEALRMCLGDKITPQSDGSYQVQGSGSRVYRVAESCSCPASQHAKSRWCKHAVGVAVYVEWQRRIHPQAPVALGTLRPGTLPLPPVTVDERLAQAPPTPDLPLIAHREEGPVYTTSDGARYTLPEGERMPDEEVSQITAQRLATEAPLSVALGTLRDATALQTHHMPQEDRMADTADIPEPDDQDAPVAVAEAPTPVPALRPRTPQVVDLEAALQVWTTERAVVQRFLKQELKANIDYYTLRIGGKDSKPSLSKAGAEKVMGWLKLQASFTPDTGTWEMLGRPQDLVCYVCTIRTRSGEIVGEGRGARSLKKDNGDVNKAIKMAEKSACVSAVLRTGALSDVFTCDLEDMQEPEPVKTATPTKPTAQGQDLRKRIWAHIYKVAPQVKTQDAAIAWVQERTGLAMEPDHYEAIVDQLGA